MQPRILRPEKGNKYYIYEKDGGVNPARGNPMRRDQFLTSLPNCTMAYGWFNEIGQRGQVYFKKAWYPYAAIAAAKREGLEVTQEPTKGGLMVWIGGKTNEGHICGVGEVYDDTHILTVESEYYGQDWKLFNRQKDDGNWRRGCPWMDKSYVYQGCIRNPFMKEEDDMTKAETEALIRKMVPEILEEIKKNTEKLPADDWAMEAINMAIARDIMVGYPDGFHPQSNIRREEVAQIVANLTAKE